MQQGFARDLGADRGRSGARLALFRTSKSAVVSSPWQTAPKEQRTERPHEAVAVPYPRHQAARRCLPSTKASSLTTAAGITANHLHRPPRSSPEWPQ